MTLQAALLQRVSLTRASLRKNMVVRLERAFAESTSASHRGAAFGKNRFIVGPDSTAAAKPVVGGSATELGSATPVDSPVMQQMMRRAERINEARAEDWNKRMVRNRYTILGLFMLVFTVYFYTMYAMGQDPDIFAEEDEQAE